MLLKMSDSETKKALDLALANIDRQYGKGTVIRLGDQSFQSWPSISTGALTLDIALGIGGLPKGRIVEIYGPESSGKTTVALNVIAQSQMSGGICAFIDVEHAFDPLYARALGVDLESLYFCQPDHGEAALDIVESLAKTGSISVIVLDSVAALSAKAEIDGDIGDSHVGIQARLMGQAMRKLTGVISKNNVTMIFTNQLREKIGVFYGNPETQPGGRALKFQASVRIDIRRSGDIKNSHGDIIGVKTKAKIVKNKMAPPMKVCEFDILYGIGVDQIGCVVDAAIAKGIMAQKGSWVYYKDENFAQGRNNAIEKLAEQQDLLNSIKAEILSEI